MNCVYNLACEEFLDEYPGKPDMIFADPPDNLGLDYDGYTDLVPTQQYYDWLELVVLKSLRITPIFWLSYYWQHDLEIKHRVRNILKYRHPSYQHKTFIWRFTFGQHNETDCGSGFRYLLRLSRKGANTSGARVESARLKRGDKRANPAGRVPDDVWDFPRVVGNAAERRNWHPTQHPEGLIERIIRLSTQEGDQIIDLFGGTGTMQRCAMRNKRDCISVELSKNYARRIGLENKIEVNE